MNAAPRCTGRTKGDKPCRNRALPGTDPPRCAVDHGSTGRPPAPPDERLVDDLAAKLREGNYIDTACKAVGLARSTYYAWCAHGAANPDGPFGQFYRRCERALAEAEAELVGTIKTAAGKDWKAAAWILERTRPEQYARPQTRPVSDAPPAPPAQPAGDEAPDGPPRGSAFDELDADTVDLAAERAARR